MATGRTVRQVKHGERLRRSQTSLNPVSSPNIEIKSTGDVARVVKTKKLVEVDGYGPYKPVPPPKPLSQQSSIAQEESSGVIPPPYRMPPYPLYNEPSIPGATVLDQPIATSSPVTPQGLHTHSSKFPIEREVILSSTEKNSKIPILHDYKKRSKVAVAPDVPPKQMAAWTQNHQILPDQTHSGLIQTIQQSNDPNGSPYRTNYHQVQDYYNGQNLNSTGAVPRTAWHAPGDTNKTTSRPLPITDDFPTNTSHPQNVTVQIESKETSQKDQKNKTMAKTYNTIKDMLSNRFKSNKENEEKGEEAGLNNMAEELRKSQGNIADEGVSKKATIEQGYQKPPITSQYNQSYMQQQMISQHAQQQYQQQLKNQQYSQQLAQARSQEMLNQQHSEEQLYYQSNYVASTPQRRQVPVPPRETNYVPLQAMQQQHLQSSPEKRSAQQLERDSLRQRSFEARRAASQPQLAYEDEVHEELPNRKPQPQIPTPMRRGSYGNIMETQTKNDTEKDSDDGGFLRRKGSQERRLDPPGLNDRVVKSDGNNIDNRKENDQKTTDELQGSPRKRLEGEIGKIEGVYNVGQRIAKLDEESKVQKKTNPSSATSSDYDKTGGQSSSNIDSGRGSAAYSSGRRPGPVDSNSDHFDSVPNVTRGKYRDLQDNSHDSEWVDIVENELRHILEPKLHELSIQNNNPGKPHSVLSESVSSMTPPLPPLSPGEQSSPNTTPRNSARYKHNSLPCGSRPEYESYKSKNHSRIVAGESRWNNSSPQKHRSQKKIDHNAILRGKQIFGLDNTDMTSTTTRSMDLESILDGQSDSDEDLSTTDARAIRKQLEGLETMYSEVLKLLGVKKHPAKYQPNDPRFTKRRYGSMSSLPSSSVSSRPIRDKRRTNEDRKKVRDIRGINKRFQRLESHVVTLARSVAHLSSEMRTQHLMIQEMENIRGEIAALRTQTNMLNVRAQSAARAVSSKDLPVLANPARVKKLTKFFGDEPPLLRLFLRKLGYEKYATIFEGERIGMVELPYLSEDRLQKMGLPLGPRLRIMQEAQISVCKDNTLCI
ncbi:uncharacterized protein LOC130452915 isoform X1 [Diorhabda sublineata]|uniref:uncharacterized protein LOC130452915 isoform X1 n=1 Tax=Diorhabda sublineata TaxID=1163346 RepID=UPI0024E113C4|nr:uncharacterized protein LOC130452915 isoform X1 [Diorhabda sublineata]